MGSLSFARNRPDTGARPADLRQTVSRTGARRDQGRKPEQGGEDILGPRQGSDFTTCIATSARLTLNLKDPRGLQVLNAGENCRRGGGKLPPGRQAQARIDYGNVVTEKLMVICSMSGFRPKTALIGSLGRPGCEGWGGPDCGKQAAGTWPGACRIPVAELSRDFRRARHPDCAAGAQPFGPKVSGCRVRCCRRWSR